MRKNEEKYAGFVIMLGVIALVAIVVFLVFRGDFEVVVIETDANMSNENVGDYINAADSQFGDTYVLEQTGNDQKTVVFFSSRWCGICNVVKTSVQNELSQRAEEPITLIEADLGINAAIAEDYSISEVPTLLLTNGEETTIYENMDIDEVEPAIVQFLEN